MKSLHLRIWELQRQDVSNSVSTVRDLTRNKYIRSWMDQITDSMCILKIQMKLGLESE